MLVLEQYLMTIGKYPWNTTLHVGKMLTLASMTMKYYTGVK